MNDKNLFSLFLIGSYRKWISPCLPKVCRFYPTCSEYAYVCFRRFSWGQAFWLTSKRLLRCHPYCEGGLDPVPPVHNHL